MTIGFLFARPGNCLPEGRRDTGDDRIIGLSLIYAAEIPTNLFGWDIGHWWAYCSVLTGIRLMYCTYAATVNFAPGVKAWIGVLSP
jgi:hypothetical protein